MIARCCAVLQPTVKVFILHFPCHAMLLISSMLHNTVTLSYVTRGVTITATRQRDTSAFRVDQYRTRCFALKT